MDGTTSGGGDFGKFLLGFIVTCLLLWAALMAFDMPTRDLGKTPAGVCDYMGCKSPYDYQMRSPSGKIGYYCTKHSIVKKTQGWVYLKP